MKRLLLLWIGWLPLTSVASEMCDSETDKKYFLSQWSEGRDHPQDILSAIDGERFSLERGKVIYRGDLNGDGEKDFIFNSYDSVGSAKDSAFAFLIQCRGYLKFMGGDYFAGVKVLDGVPQGGGTFKEIEIYSYIRDRRGQIRYKGKEAMTRPHLWHFNPQTQRYEGQSE